jgi:hypothetical protein
MATNLETERQDQPTMTAADLISCSIGIVLFVLTLVIGLVACLWPSLFLWLR